MSADRDMTICCLALWRMSFHMNYTWGLHNHDLLEDTDAWMKSPLTIFPVWYIFIIWDKWMPHCHGSERNRSQKASKCGRKSVKHLASSCVPLFCSYFILIYYWTDAKQHENLFVIYLLSYVSNCTIISLISLFLSWSSGSRKFCLTVLSSASFISARFEKASPASWRAWPVGKF